MKTKISLLIVLLFTILLSFGCSGEYNEIEDVDCPIDYTTYVYEECVGLPLYSSFTTMYITNLSKGNIIFTKEELEEYKYKKVNYTYNLDDSMFFFSSSNENKIKNNAVRYDIYLNDEFTYQSIVLWKNNTVYLYRFGENMEGIYNIQSITKLRRVTLFEYREERLVNKNNINSKEVFLDTLSKIESLDPKKSSYNSDVINCLNKLEYGFNKVEVVFLNYFIGENILFTCYIIDKELFLELSYYKDGKILLINNTVEEFEEFINRYYNNSYYGRYANRNDYLSINLRKDNFNSSIGSENDSGSFVKEDDYFIFKIDGNLSSYYFKYSDETIIDGVSYRTLTYDLTKSIINDNDVSKIIIEDGTVFRQIKK